MKKFNRKIRSALFILFVCLIAFIGFSKTGILFSDSGKDVITVSTTKKTFDPNRYVASVMAATQKKEEPTTTTTVSTTTMSTTTATKSSWTGDVLSKSKGVVNGPSGRETYYNLNMTSVINSMRRAGYSEVEYPYWVREDGVKMLGNYVMVAANYNIRPKGSIIESSLGAAIVCDTGSFVKHHPTQIDVAVTWR